MSEPQLEFSPLLDWVEGRLSPQASQEIELLLVGAGETSLAAVTWLRRFHAARRVVRIADPPPTMRDALREQFAAFVAARRQPGLLERVVASLSFDSLARPLGAPGVRTVAGASPRPRQLVFSCSTADIALHVHRRPNDMHLDLSGQIFPHDARTPAGWGILLIGEGGPDATYSDDLGEFAFEEIAPGDYTITLETSQIAITMPMVTLAP